MTVFTCKECFPKLCTCHRGAGAAYMRLCSDGFWFHRTLLLNEHDGRCVAVNEEGNTAEYKLVDVSECGNERLDIQKVTARMREHRAGGWSQADVVALADELDAILTDLLPNA